MISEGFSRLMNSLARQHRFVPAQLVLVIALSVVYGVSAAAQENNAQDDSDQANPTGIDAAQPDDVNPIPVPKASMLWSSFRGDEKAHAYSPTQLPDELELVWDYEFEEGGFIAAPIILENKVYLADMDGIVMQLDFESGEPGWTVDLDAFIDASPAIIDRFLIVGDLDGFMYGVNIDSGELAWKQDLESSFITSVNHYQGDVIAMGETGDLFRLKPDTGETVWHMQIDDRILSFPSIVDGRCFLTGCNSKLYSVKLDDEPEIVSEYMLRTPSGVTAALDDDLAYFAISGGIVMCIDWRKGESQWEYLPQRGDDEIASSPALTDEYLVVAGGVNRKVTVINRESGEEKWVYTTRRMINTSPVVAGDNVVIAGNDGRLYVFDIESGDVEFEFEFGGVPAAAPAIASERIVIATNQGQVYCFGNK